jgi:DNA-binding XRE family transcriptional regulator
MKSLIETMRGESYTEQEFFERLNPDLLRARRSTILTTGYVSTSRIRQMETILATRIQAGVRICAYIQHPDNWGRPLDTQTSSARAYLRQFQICLDHLRELGVHVNPWPGNHYKIVVIDNSILWDGSLNPLSFNKRTAERMTRWVDPVQCARAIEMHKLQKCDECSARQHPTNPAELNLDPGTVPGIIIARRRKLGITQAELAKLVNVDRKTIAKIETGLRSPTTDTLIKIAHVLGRQVALVPPSVIENVHRIIELEHDE